MTRLKNWQLFCVTWLPLLALMIYGQRQYYEILKPICMLTICFGLLRWLWEICILIPDKIMANSGWHNPAKKLFIVPAVYFAAIITGFSTTIFHSFAGAENNLSLFEIGMIVMFFINAFCLIQLFRIAAALVFKIDRNDFKTSKIVLFLFFMFSIVGLWFIQPKINKTFKR